MGEDIKPGSADMVNDDEARLKDRLEGKKQERNLKEKLMAKKERRQSETESEKNGSNSKEGGGGKGNSGKSSPSNSGGGGKNDSPNGGGGSDHSGTSGGGRRGSDNMRDGRRSSSMDRHGGGGFRRGPDYNRGPYNNNNGRGDFHHRGPWDGPRGGGGPYYEDRFGRAPPPGHYAMRGDFRCRYDRGPPPPPGYDDFGRAPRRYQERSRSRSRSVSRSYSSRSRSRSRSPSRSVSRSRSRSRSRSISEDERRSSNKRGRSSSDRSGRRRKERRRGGRSSRRRSRSPSSSGSSISSSSSSSSSSDGESDLENDDNNKADGTVDNFTKDQRTVFVTQLVMRTTSKDIRRYFSRKVGAKVNEVILLKDRRTGKHKGAAYIELKSMSDVGKALGVSGQAPDFQRFPVLVKPSEAEKNYIVPASTATVTANMMGAASASVKPMIGPDGKLMESQKVYVGNLDPSITQEHLFKLFSPFGDLTKVSLQMDPASGISKGYAFLSFRDPKEAHLAISAMASQLLAGKCMKTGWATMTTAAPGVTVVTSEAFPDDANVRVQKARVALTQLALGAGFAAPPAPVVNTAMTAVVGQQPQQIVAPAPSANKVPTVAEARHSLATTAAQTMAAATTPAAFVSPDAKVIGRAEQPSPHLLIRNMYDKDQETEPNWADEIAEEFREECSKFGKIEHVLVMKNDPGGKIYASFDTIEAAKNCASSLAGRWFDKRQLRVEFVSSEDIPKEA